MTDPITQINTATKQYFMPVVQNMMFLDSPVLGRIFKIAQEGNFGMAVPAFDGRSIVEPLELGEVAQVATTFAAGTVTTTNGSATVTHSATGFLSAMANPGSYVTLADGKAYSIASITSTSVLVLKNVYEGTGGGGESFSMVYYPDVANATGSYGRTDDWVAASGDVLGGAEFTWRIGRKATIRPPKITSNRENSEIENSRQGFIPALETKRSNRYLISEAIVQTSGKKNPDENRYHNTQKINRQGMSLLKISSDWEKPEIGDSRQGSVLNYETV